MEHKKISRKRHIAKAFTWRVTATTTTFLLTWLVTGKLTAGFAVGGLEFFSKMALYYWHERAWYRFGYGVMESAGSEKAAEVEA
jgi:uncharacterized membrane protein